MLNNAFKYASSYVSFRAGVNEGFFEIVTNNDGDKVPESMMEEIFKPFVRIGSGELTVSQGSGIGLALARNLAEALGGTLAMDASQKDNCFRFSLPVNIEPETPAGPESLEPENAESPVSESPALSQRRFTVLVVEDNAQMLSMIARQMEEHYKVYTARNGNEALDVLALHTVNVVVSDVMMPGMDGMELCSSIKKSLDFSHIPVILLTALNDDHQRMYGIAEGADDYIPKPFNLELVKLRILQVIEERQRLRERFSQQLNQLPAMTAIDESTQPAPDTSLPPVNTMNDRFLQRFVEMLETHYNDPDFNIEKGSERLGLSRVHLYRKVKEVTGLSPTDFLRNFRLQKAAQLLSQRAATISEVAYSTGFSSPAYFAKCFKALYAITPTEYVNGGTCS